MEKLKKFADKLRESGGGNFVCFAVYGSCVSGGMHKDSDINTILILNDASAQELDKISKHIRSYTGKKTPMPLIFAKERFFRSGDVFPMEFSDIKENHRVIAGEDIFSGLEIDNTNLRLEIEREFKSKIIKLRQSYIHTGGSPGDIKKLMAASISTFAALMKGLLRLKGIKAPRGKKEIIMRCGQEFGIDANFLALVLLLKDDNNRLPDSEANEDFTRYLSEIEKLTDIADGL
ncbi:MAG: hypothetical protein ACLFP1_08740 [Candidatus Goldiibacteriota bacterium]